MDYGFSPKFLFNTKHSVFWPYFHANTIDYGFWTYFHPNTIDSLLIFAVILYTVGYFSSYYYRQ